MSLHYNIATHGVRAGHKILAKLGFGFHVEVIITPKDTGGGYGPSWIPDQQEYLITVKITKNGKIWQKSMEANRFQMKSLERIILTFKSVNTIIENISFNIKMKSINIKNILVEAWKK